MKDKDAKPKTKEASLSMITYLVPIAWEKSKDESSENTNVYYLMENGISTFMFAITKEKTKVKYADSKVVKSLKSKIEKTEGISKFSNKTIKINGENALQIDYNRKKQGTTVSYRKYYFNVKNKTYDVIVAGKIKKNKDDIDSVIKSINW